MAVFGRSLQCSLAIADLAKHIDGANLKDALTKDQLKELVQVLGTLSTEAALQKLLGTHSAYEVGSPLGPADYEEGWEALLEEARIM